MLLLWLYIYHFLVLIAKIHDNIISINFFQDASVFYLLENAIALFLALLVNVAIVALSAAICVDNLSADTNTCSTLTLKSAFILFKVNLAETQLYKPYLTPRV